MKRLYITSLTLFVVIAGVLLWWSLSVQPADKSNQQTKAFVITKGDGVREVAKKLHDQGLIRDQVAFFLLVKKLGLETNIQAGSYQLSPSMTAEALARKLTLGTEDVWVTIPEGWRLEEIVNFLEKQGFNNEPIGAQINFTEFKQLEGRYFPDTYLVPKSLTTSKFLNLMQSNFSKKVNFPITTEQLIIASMVEREARSEQDRPIVAGVIGNRLKDGMALNIDAAVQYAIGYTEKDGWWKKELTVDDLKFKSPYNTYTNSGLPPGPICNPGISSLKAAVNPAKTDYLYYISDKSGKMHYAKTLNEHNQNVAKYLTN